MPIVLQLITLLAPMVRQSITDWKASHNGTDPTDEQVIATLHANVQKVLDEGTAWRVAHGDAVAPPPELAAIEPVKASLIALLQALSANADGVATLLLTPR